MVDYTISDSAYLTCMLSLFLIGRMFLHEPSWNYLVKLVSS